MDNKRLLEKYKLDMLGLRSMSERGLQAYMYKIMGFCNWVEIALEDVAQDHVRNYMLAIKKANQAINTQRGTVTALKSFYRWMMRNLYINIDPTEDLQAVKKELLLKESK